MATEALQIGTDGGQPDAAIIFGAQFMNVSVQRGTLGDLIPLIEQMAADNPDISRLFTRRLAMAHAEADRTDEARPCWSSSQQRLRSSLGPGVDHRNGLLR